MLTILEKNLYHRCLKGFFGIWNFVFSHIEFCFSYHDFCLSYLEFSLREKCPNTEFFLVRIFPYSDWIRGDSISPYSVRIHENTYQKKLRIWTLYTQCLFSISWILFFQILNFNISELWNILCVFESSKREQFKTQTRWDALHDLVPFAQFQKCKKHPWSCVTFSKVASWSLQLY